MSNTQNYNSLSSVYASRTMFYTALATHCAFGVMLLLNIWVLHHTFTQDERTLQAFIAMFVALGTVTALCSLIIGVCNLLLYNMQSRLEYMNNIMFIAVPGNDENSDEKPDNESCEKATEETIDKP